MSKPTSTAEECYATIVETFLSKSGVTQEGKGFGSAALKINGKIFAMLAGGKFVVKLSRQRVDELISSGEGQRYDPRHDGRLMKEWLTVASIAEELWLSLAAEAMEFAVLKRE